DGTKTTISNSILNKQLAKVWKHESIGARLQELKAKGRCIFLAAGARSVVGHICQVKGQDSQEGYDYLDKDHAPYVAVMGKKCILNFFTASFRNGPQFE